MLIMYIDESGDTLPLSKEGTQFLVLTGCIVEDRDKLQIEQEFRKLKVKFYHNPDVEIKSNFLRYANPELEGGSPIKLKDRQKYDELESDVAFFLKNIPAVLYSVVIHKPTYWQKYPAQNPYEIAYIFLAERFQKYLEQKDSLGICIIDPREGQVEKHFIGSELDQVHDLLRWGDGHFWRKCPNIIEKLLFATSDRAVGIQLADLFCYPVFNVFEYNKTKDEYWRYQDITFPRLSKIGSRVDGVGLKFFPESSKKDLRYFA